MNIFLSTIEEEREKEVAKPVFNQYFSVHKNNPKVYARFLPNKINLRTQRMNPASPGAVTGSATYASFFSSLLRVGGKGSGFHLC